MEQNEVDNKSLVPFNETPEWNQDIALARAEFLKQVDKYVDIHSKDLGKTKSLERFLKIYNKGRICQDLRKKLKRKRVRRSTYYDWLRRFKQHGLSGLLKKYNNGGCRITPEVQGEIKRIIWENHLCRYQDIYEDLQVIFSEEKSPSYSSIRRFAKSYRERHWAELVLKHEGKKGLRDRNMLPAIGRMDESLTRPNQRWEVDTTIADLFTGRKIKDVVLKTKDGKRCKVIGVIDVFSRMLKFYLTEKESSLIIGTVIKDRILVWGVPIEIVIDNGKPYKNHRLKQFLRGIGISAHFCTPGSPEEKPFIERAFRTLSEKLFRRLLGYSGNRVETRPNEIEIKYTKAEAQQIIDDYVINVYAEAIHGSTGQRPRERMRPLLYTPITINERELDILLMEQHERKVRQGHIAYLGGKYFHPKLPEGQKVIIRVNDFDASELLVFVDNKYLCTAEDLKRKGKTPEEILEAKKERNRELRTRINAHEALINKSEPKDHRILALIEHHKKNKPIELPQKAEVIGFPELKNISYSSPGVQEAKTEGSDTHDSKELEGGLIRNRQEMYLKIQRKQKAGKPLDDSDRSFLEEYLESNEYRMIGSYLERQLQAEGGA